MARLVVMVHLQRSGWKMLTTMPAKSPTTSKAACFQTSLNQCRSLGKRSAPGISHYQHAFCSSFRRKPGSILILLFVPTAKSKNGFQLSLE
jgi:hypothetical protein